MNIQELEKREAELWEELKTLSIPVDAKRREWAECSRQITTLKQREEIRQQLRAELLAETAAGTEAK